MLKEQRGLEWILTKLVPICGDVMLPELGISSEDADILRNEVSLVMHCAATVRFVKYTYKNLLQRFILNIQYFSTRFDEPLRRAVFMNVRGTKYMLELASTFKQLDLFCHVSTAYCHLHVKTLYEKPYDPPGDPYSIMSACEWLGDDEIASIEKRILGTIPNTYAYTKSLGESLVVEKFDKIPAVILRPSIVIPIWREPVPGWTDNINGPTGLLIGAGKGVIRTMYCQQNGYGDFLPVDVAVNAMLVATWRFLTPELGPVESRVAHLTSSNEIKVSWSEIIEIGRWVIENRVPLNGVAWYPGGSMKSNYIVHWICMILFHWMPAIFVDLLLRILGYPPV